MSREEIQKEALDAWIGNDCNGALILGTGVGKTKIAIDAIRYHIINYHPEGQWNGDVRILWLTNSERLRDIDTRADFEKWEAEDLLQYVEFQCIQTAYKYNQTKWDLVVADEGDFMLTEEYFKFFTNNSYFQLLFLTATVDKTKQEMLDSLCKTVYTYTTTQAQDDGILNKSTITFAKYMLDDKDKYIPTKGKNKSVFYQTENECYSYLEKRCIAELLKYNTTKSLYDGAVLVSNQSDIIRFEKQLKTCQATHKFWTTKRANFLWELKKSVRVAQVMILSTIKENKTNKCLVFSKRTEQVEKIVKVTYHAKNKKDNTALEDLSSSKTRVVGVVQAVNRGVNINGLTHLIFESYDGSSTSFQQRHGRGTRLGVDDVMNAYILVPYYKDKDGKVKPTQAYKWAKDMTADFTNIKEIEV